MKDAPLPVVAQQTPGDDAFTAAIKAAQADIAASVATADLRNDPLRFPLAAISTAIGLFPDFLRYMRETAEEARSPLDAEAVARMEKAAAEGASRASGALVQAHNRRSVLIGSLTVAVCIVGSAAAGFWYGRTNAIAQFSVAEAGFASLVHDDPASATGWLSLMRLNDYQKVLSTCHGDRAFTDPAGRHACMAALWLDSPTPAEAPRAAPKPQTSKQIDTE